MAKRQYHIRGSVRPSKQIVGKIESPLSYSPGDFGLSTTLTGKGVSIAVIDTGCPDHSDIRNVSDCVDMRDELRPNGSDCADKHGHATMLAGIIGGSSGKTIQGIAPDADMLFAKVAGSNGQCNFQSLVGAVLWAVVKKVDIILVSLGSQSDYPVFHSAIKKAYSQNISVIAAAGNRPTSDYPARYPEVLSVSKMKVADKTKHGGKFVSDTHGVQMSLPSGPIYTTHLNGKYTTATGTSLSAAFAAGLAALLIEQNVSKDKKFSNNSLYAQISNLSCRI